jgi:integrase
MPPVGTESLPPSVRLPIPENMTQSNLFWDGATRITPNPTQEVGPRLAFCNKDLAEPIRERRLHLLVLILLDTGARISETLGIRVADVDLDNMLVTLYGKGREQREVPFSLERKKNSLPHTREFCPQPPRRI